MKKITWQENLGNSLKNSDVLVLYGNIRDKYVYTHGKVTSILNFKELVTTILRHSEGILCYDPYSKVTRLTETAGVVSEQPENGYGEPGFTGDVNVVITRILDQMERKEKTDWMLNMAHNILPYKASYEENERLRLIAFQRMFERIIYGNKLIMCYLSDTQVPLEFSENMPKVTFVKIPEPEIYERHLYWSLRLPLISGKTIPPAILEAHASKLSLLTDGFAMSTLDELYASLQRSVDIENFPAENWEKIVKTYKFGQQVDYFGQIEMKKLQEARKFFIETEGIKGQDEAVEKVIEMLWRARTNVASLLDETSNVPKGVLFFAGPSGVGKTMLAKKLAKFIFETEESFLRFDMSEYYDTHTISRLIGAPPGYVGYEEGGVLTNKVKEKPFCVILFDEIEKAHFKIFDIFLQILSDGRLTDSRGQTVFFSETVIVFTSNIGSEDNLLFANESREIRNKHFVKCVQNFFRSKIGRPELLGRIGNNIIPFNTIEDDDVIHTAINYNLDLLEKNFNRRYAGRKYILHCEKGKISLMIINKFKYEIKELGIREVVNIIKDKILTKLAQHILIAENSLHESGLNIYLSAENGEIIIYAQ